MKTIGILGAGTWGMALARMLCISGHAVTVWSAIEREIDEFSSNYNRFSGKSTSFYHFGESDYDLTKL